MKHHDHKDGFIPKYLIQKLADRGNEDAKRTLVQMEKIDEKIVKKIDEEKKNNENHLFAANANTSKRMIYDSENTPQFKKKLVREEGGSPVQDEVVNIAYDFIGQTLNYFKNKLGRNSIDNNGMNVICNVHFNENPSEGGYNNATWSPGLNQLAIGDGDGRTFINLARSIDVVAHEMAHGVTQFVNELDYERQSGALNEHFSDVIGTAVQQYVKGQTAQTADWLIGDEIVGPNWPGKALRSMKAPGTASEIDDQPSHMRDYKELPINVDDGGVHINSGIPNKAFFLVAMEIGTDSAAFLWYTALHDKQNIHSKATFLGTFKAILKAAETLVQQNKLPQKAISSVKNAFEDVGIATLARV